MRYGILGVVALVVFGGFGLAWFALAAASDAESGPEAPAVVEPVAGTSLSRITLTEKAAQRLGIETAAVRQETVAETPRLVIPYGAVLYDANGGTWTYTNPEPLVFVRHEIAVDRIDGDKAILSAGPPVDTDVVTVGAAELVGTEYGVGH